MPLFAMIRDASDLLDKLLDGGHSTVAGRLAGGFRNCGRGAIAGEIIAAMTVAGYDEREHDPFSEQSVMTLPLRVNISVLGESCTPHTVVQIGLEGAAVCAAQFSLGGFAGG